MKKSLLDIVQSVLSDMDSDEVNSISDTIEAQQVADIVQITYEEIINDRKWPHLQELAQLMASGDSNFPTYMTLDEKHQELLWVKYNKRKLSDTRDRYAEVLYQSPDEFLCQLNTRISSDSNTMTVTDPSGVVLLIKTNKAPTYWTSFDDETIIFDSYDSAVDSTLQTSKTQAYVYKEAAFVMMDSAVPDLPAKAFPYLIAEVKSVASNALRQVANQKEEQRSRRQRTWLAREKWRQDGATRSPNYGR